MRPVSVRRTAGIPHPAGLGPVLGPVLGLLADRAWTGIPLGAGTVAVAERDALGTTARVAAWPPADLATALAAVDAVLAGLDRQASRFRADSELSVIHRAPGQVHRLSRGLAEAVRVALTAAGWTGGLVDPTVGCALIALGYDRDFAAIGPGPRAPRPGPGPAPGWRSVSLDGAMLRLPPGVRLDLGATAKGLGADRAASPARSISPKSSSRRRESPQAGRNPWRARCSSRRSGRAAGPPGSSRYRPPTMSCPAA